MKTIRRTILVKSILLSTLVLTVATAQTEERHRLNQNDGEERILSVEDYHEPWITGDTNGDGSTDYALKLDDQGRKKLEAVDHNNDGTMDNFYYYRNGVLSRQEIDTNYDGRIDLWIYMHDGVRVQGYERDTNHDGVVDFTREFGDS